MLAQTRRHLRKRLEQTGQGAAVGLNHRVAFVGDVIVHRAVVGVNHHLHRVADVVQAVVTKGVQRDVQRSGVGIAVAHSIGVTHPPQLAVCRHDVGVAVMHQEGGNHLHPFTDVAPEQQSAVRRQVTGEQQVAICHAEGVGEFCQQVSADGDTACALIARVLVFALRTAVQGGVVELVQLRVHDDGVVRRLAVVDFRSLQPEGNLALRGNIAHQVLRLSLCCSGVDRSHHHTVAVCVLQAQVLPCFG
ncbi:hypothetical protein HRbin16_01253 [bacterium HR16]|nr:hypothetical protein HRbin16_01253 [bacterium HR16]